MKKFLVLATAAALAQAAPANATLVTFNLTGNSDVTGTDGNTRIFTAATGPTTVKVMASGWSLDGSTIRDSFIGAYSGGLGVTSGDEDGNNNTHVVDNQNRTDFILLQFDQAVQLTSANFNVFSIGGSSDSDATIGYGNSATPWNTPMALNDKNVSVLNAALTSQFVSLGGSTSGSRNIGPGNLTGNLWLVSAAMVNADGKFDGFKLANVTVNTIPTVPEPATWALMLLGFGLVAGFVRQRNRKAILISA